MATLIAPEAIEPMMKTILEMAGHKYEDKKETVEGQLVAAITNLTSNKFDGNLPAEISVEDIRQKLNYGKLERFQISPQKLGKRIQSLSLKTKAVNGRARLVITARELDVLKEQYGLFATTSPEETPQLTITHLIPRSFNSLVGRESVDSPPDCGEHSAENAVQNQALAGVVGSGSQPQGTEALPRRVGWKKQ